MRDHLALPDDEIAAELLNAVQAGRRLLCRRARGNLLLLAFREFMFAATNMLRLRMMSGVGHLRVQVETVALAVAMQADPIIAIRWLQLRTDQEGRRFFGQHMRYIDEFRQRHEDLEGAWNMASGGAQHARFASLVGGLDQLQSREGDRAVTEYHLNFQDVRADRPADFFIRVLFLLRVQIPLLSGLLEALPEASDELLRATRLPRYARSVVQLHALFEQRFPDFVRRHRHTD